MMFIYNKFARVAVLAALLAGAAECAAAAPARFATFENDSHFDTDHYYSNGIQFSYKRSDDTRGTLGHYWSERLCGWLGCQDATLLTSRPTSAS